MPTIALRIRFEYCEEHCSYLGLLYLWQFYPLFLSLIISSSMLPFIPSIPSIHPSLHPSLHLSLHSLLFSSLLSSLPLARLPSLFPSRPFSPLFFPLIVLPSLLLSPYPLPFPDISSDIPEAIYVGVTMSAPLFLPTPHINNNKTFDDVLPEHVQKMAPLKIGEICQY